MKQTVASLGVFCLVILMVYGVWSCKRRVNYNLGYKSLVGEQIQKELKPINARLEALEKRANQVK
jgi:hypothetical protein